MSSDNVRWFQDLGLADLDQVGGKNASLGEMIANLVSAGVAVPDGFATTADAFRRFVAQIEAQINDELGALDVEDTQQLAEVGRRVRSAVLEQPFPEDLERDIREAFTSLDADGSGSFAVRSSATAEDLPDASFAGQQETFLNVRGIDAVLTAIRRSSRRCTTTGRSPTGCTTGSSTPRWRCPPACSGWSARTWAPPG